LIPDPKIPSGKRRNARRAAFSRVRGLSMGCLAAVAAVAIPHGLRAEDTTLASFERDVEPMLDQYCYDCHGDGSKKGGVRLDGFTSGDDLRNHALWMRVMKNVRTGIMPPASEPRIAPEDERKLMAWIKRQAFSLDPEHPDPGRVTLRRLNRVEYRNTVRELTGVDYDTLKEFPADDTGQGFDNIGDVLTISPMLLERYLDTAQTVVGEAVPTRPLVEASVDLPGKRFATLSAPDPNEAKPGPFKRPLPRAEGDSLDLSYYTPAKVGATYHAANPGKYQLSVSLKAVEAYVDDQFDLNRCRLVFKADGETLISQEFVRESDKDFSYTFDRAWKAGDHALTFEVVPIGPDKDQKRQLRIRLGAVTVRGPEEPEFWVQPATYTRFFPRKVPWWPASRRRYEADILRNFASRAFRRPVDLDTVNRLVGIAESVSAQPGNTFESGVAQAMSAVLASPRFIFRQEETEPLQKGQAYPFVDQYSLATRLSYFLWSSMPDDELFQLAAKGQLREQLPAQFARMLADPKSGEFIRNFTGQWLEARDIENVQINPIAVYLREHPNPEAEKALDTFRRINRIPDDQRTAEDKAAFAKARAVFVPVFRAPKPQLTESLRVAMRRESEMVFEYVIKGDRCMDELIESNYTFLNEELAKHYGIPGVTGKQMRFVQLPPGSPRGGVITEGTVLAVTSNPTRTSPVKRGVFILDSILGTRPPPPPPNIPALEDAASPEKLRTMTLRENLAVHATNKSCAACHSRMDPIGLALENFNAMGSWRDGELNRPIDPSGKLITGESFADIRELKHILATKHRRDFYYCITEKLMTYALGRTLDYYDTETVDRLVEGLESSGGRPSTLLLGIINSAPFQQRRQPPRQEEVAADAAAGPKTADTP
jgi:mono/diheme cytochrome c family protein